MQQFDAQERGRSDLNAWRREARQSWYGDGDILHRVVRRLRPAQADRLHCELVALDGALDERVDDLVRENNRDENLPVVRHCDDFGRPTEQVEHHPSYHGVGAVFWRSGVLARIGEPGHEVEAGAVATLLDHLGEAGHACPVACTAGAIKLIRDQGSEAQQHAYLPALLETDYDRRLHAAQFVTEVQGGSDVGANGCTAEPDATREGWYRISGEKWFCSVADAGIFVVSARIAGAGEGTRGLGLFLVPREIDGRPNGFRLRRLKTKLGTRSMPTGEIDFNGALGEPIGPLDHGFRNLVGVVLDTSRVHNAMAACGLMRRALAESRAYARHRRAFDKPIGDFAAVREILARMRVRTLAAQATTFRVLDLTDRVETGDDDALRAARRISVMINKYWTAVASTAVTRDGIEIQGGNGTIEEFSVLPRLYRDAIVIESWEGTHNTLCAQVFRDFAVRRLHEPFFAQLEAEVAAVTESGGVRDTAVRLLRSAQEGVAAVGMASGDPGALFKAATNRIARAIDWIALASQYTWDLEHAEPTELGDALDWYRLREVENRDGLTAPELVDLEQRLGAP
jgi:acyl-CoA dehydrogenase